MLPAVAQGAIGVEVRDDDDRARELLAALNDNNSETVIAAERAFLGVLDGSCRTPMAGLATLDNGNIHLRSEVLSLDGGRVYSTERHGPASDAVTMGKDAGDELKAAAGPDIFSP